MFGPLVFLSDVVLTRLGCLDKGAPFCLVKGENGTVAAEFRISDSDQWTIHRHFDTDTNSAPNRLFKLESNMFILICHGLLLH